MHLRVASGRYTDTPDLTRTRTHSRSRTRACSAHAHGSREGADNLESGCVLGDGLDCAEKNVPRGGTGRVGDISNNNNSNNNNPLQKKMNAGPTTVRGGVSRCRGCRRHGWCRAPRASGLVLSLPGGGVHDGGSCLGAPSPGGGCPQSDQCLRRGGRGERARPGPAQARAAAGALVGLSPSGAWGRRCEVGGGVREGWPPAGHLGGVLGGGPCSGSDLSPSPPLSEVCSACSVVRG